MKKNLTEIVTIIDKSGSMDKLTSRTIEGFNSFLKEQKNVKGEANFSTVLFSGHGKEKIIFDSINIQEISELNEENYVCGGLTALYDAIGKTIKALKKRIKYLNENVKPEKVLLVILTDGLENDSRCFDKEKIFNMINKCETDNKWAVLYLGANQDAFAEGGKMGIKSHRTSNYAATEKGILHAYDNMSSFTASYRMSSDVETANALKFNDDENTDNN